ncbi:PKD domain-containing protein [Pedobacter changchengzhani]|nr:PKD domain-containing protein [Pedobacter changchengzhani]
MKRSWLLVTLLLCILSFTKTVAQNISNEGTDFWSVFPTHEPSVDRDNVVYLGQIAIFVTAKQTSEVTVSAGSFSSTKTIPANTAVQFDVPRTNAYVNKNEANQNIINRGIHIKVTDGKPKVSAYTHIYGKARSAASLILPFETLGQTYYSMNFTQTPGGSNYLTLVGVEPNTTVNIHEKSGNIIKVNLANPGDVYEYLPRGTPDITGVYVETDAATSSCKRFAAFSGSSVIGIVCTGSQDPIFQQLYPTVSWGKTYGIVPFFGRRCIVRIMAQEDNTSVTFNGSTQVINKGAFIESGQLTSSTYITADKLISVAQYSLTQACSSASGGSAEGDPEMVILNPIEFNISNVTVFSSNLENITAKYINVLIRANKTASFKINGTAPSTTWSPLAGNANYSYTQIPVTATSLTLSADDGFNAIAYGFGSVESYGYSAGTNLAANNFLTVVNDSKNEENQNGCVGTKLDLKVNLTYQPDKIVWTLDGEAPEEILNPTPEVKVINGQTLYVYRYNVGKTYNVVGEHHLKVDAHVPTNASTCVSGDLTTNYVFIVYSLPIAKFDVADSGCEQAAISFTDQSTTDEPNASVIGWLWDFKDGTTSTDQNPKHQFAQPGVYEVSLIAKSTLGCYADAVSKSITINPVPVSSFLAFDKTCVNTDLVITDQSSIRTAEIPTALIKTWHWVFGDGTNEDRTDALPFVHKYTATGTYTITLTTTSETGCESNVFSKSVEVTELPSANFTMPNICLNDGTAKFINTSTDVDGTNTGFTYLWDFGDTQSPGNGVNTSTDKDGTHTYTKADIYNVTLTITNASGCISVKTQSFTVNGSNPMANFDILDQSINSLCGNNPIVIKNTSTVDFGSITRIEVYKDFDNDPTNFETFTAPIPPEILLNYQSFGTPSTKTFNVALKAFSGTVCSSFISKAVALKASPILSFSAINPICENDGQVMITQSTETSGIPGDGTYSSDANGMSIDGKFNPKLAGVGTHNITYLFNADNGCSSSITQSITVNASPTADAGETLYILAGGEIPIPAVASGNNLVFSWLPVEGLNNPNVLNPIASPEQDTQYTLTATTDLGCTATSKVTVKVLEGVTPPNTFTPNGDGINDVWNIKYLETYPNATVEVFNRDGVRVFFSKGYSVPFDGNYMGSALPVGVYYFLISPKNGRKNISGPLTIIR